MKEHQVIWDKDELPPKKFWDEHWKNGNGKTVVMPAKAIYQATGKGLNLANLLATRDLLQPNVAIGEKVTRSGASYAQDLYAELGLLHDAQALLLLCQRSEQGVGHHEGRERARV